MLTFLPLIAANILHEIYYSYLWLFKQGKLDASKWFLKNKLNLGQFGNYYIDKLKRQKKVIFNSRF